MLYMMGTHEGVRVRKSTGTTDAVVAQSMIEQTKLEIEAGRLVAAPQARPIRAAGPTFRDAADGYLKRPGRDLVWATWCLNKVLLPELGDTPLVDMTAKRVEEWKLRHFASRSVKPATIAHYLAIIRGVLSYANDAGLMDWMPKIRLPHVDNQHDRYLDEAQIRAFFAELRARTPFVVPLYLFLLYTGARPVEAMRVQWSDVIDLEGKEPAVVLTNRKGGRTRRRSVPLHDVLAKMLRKTPVAQRAGAIFRSQFGTPWSSPTCFLHYFRPAADAAGLQEYKPYDLRHTFASHLRLRGEELDVIRKLLGHSTINTTQRYAHLGKGHMERAAVGKLASLTH